jgi:hypothetical protein
LDRGQWRKKTEYSRQLTSNAERKMKARLAKAWKERVSEERRGGRGRVEELGYIKSSNRRHPGGAHFGPY